ncbi:MAG: replication initiation protein [Elusimicrobiota bacterium]
MKDKAIMPFNKQILNIHSSAIHIENKISLLSRQTWFFMLYKAIPYLESHDIFRINLKELKSELGYNSHNTDYLKESIKELANIKIEWNIFDKDKGEIWGIGSLLADCEIISETGICEYSFSPKVKQRFINPNMYVKLNLLVSKKFKSKHTLAIYCLVLDYLNLKDNYGEKHFSLKELRKYLGLEEHEYKNIGDLNRRIIKKVESDINKDSDIRIKITPKTEGAKDKILGFKFEMSIKDEFLESYRPKKLISNTSDDKKLPENKQTNIFEHIEVKEIDKVKTQVIKPEVPKREVIKIENEVLKKFFAKYNISITTETIQKKFKEIQEMLGADKLENYLSFLSRYAENEYNKGTIKNFSGFFVALFKDDVQIENYLHELDRENKRIKEKINKIENKLESKIKEKYDSAMLSNFEEYIVENIERIEDKFIEVINTNIKDCFARDFLIKGKNKGIVDKTLILNYISHFRMPLITELEKYKEDLWYKKPSYEEWKSKNINEKYLNELRIEIEKLDS